MSAVADKTNGELADKLDQTKLSGAASNGNGHAAEQDAGADSGDDEDDDDAGANAGGAAPTGGAKKKNKKKKSGAAKKKAAKAKQTVSPAMEQTEPPTIGLTKIFTNGVYPVGEIQQYDESKFDDARKRVTDEELRERERITQEQEGYSYNLVRRAAEVHRQVRQYAQRTIKPGMPMMDIAHLIENSVRALAEGNGLEAGVGFPTGLSLNECAAHYTPNPGDKRVLKEEDVLKVDIGVHVKGRIVDSAFTLTFGDSPWNPLLDAVKAATNAGIKEAGIDVRLGEIGGAIQEVMESHEFDVNGKTHHVKCVQNLNGHSIGLYAIHASKSVPIVNMPNLTTKMEEGEYFAIETFGSTGKGFVVDSGECSHYARKLHAPKVPLRVSSARPLLAAINKEFGSLPWCRRYLEERGVSNYLLGLRHLVQLGVVQDYPPLSDLNPVAPDMPVMTAQFEHTILLRPTCKEVVSRGDDY